MSEQLLNEIGRAAVEAHLAGRLYEALEGYRRVAALNPHIAAVYRNMMRAAHELESHADIEFACRGLLSLEPSDDLHYRFAVQLLLVGRYSEAWPHFEYRATKGPGGPQTKVPEWKGESLAGKTLVVWEEQGFGDQIQMARYVPLLDGHVLFACRDPLRRLLSRLCPTVSRTGSVTGRFDYWVSSLSLPLRFGTTLETIPPPAHFGIAAGSGGGIGVVTRGAPYHLNDSQRSMPPGPASQLLALPGARSLHVDDTGARDFLATAELIADLDLVISVDTAIAHLAASMGKPTWILLPRVKPCWRWLRDRSDSPWYPCVRLFRQPAAGDWASVTAEVREALTEVQE